MIPSDMFVHTAAVGDGFVTVAFGTVLCNHFFLPYDIIPSYLFINRLCLGVSEDIKKAYNPDTAEAKLVFLGQPISATLGRLGRTTLDVWPVWLQN